MKSFASLFMSFVLTAAMLTGCGCTNRNTGMTTPTTMPTQASTEPSGTNGSTDETINHGNGPLVEESTGASESTAESTAQSRSRNMPIK